MCQIVQICTLLLMIINLLRKIARAFGACINSLKLLYKKPSMDAQYIDAQYMDEQLV